MRPPFEFLKHSAGFAIFVPGFDCDSGGKPMNTKRVQVPPLVGGSYRWVIWGFEALVLLAAGAKSRNEKRNEPVLGILMEKGNRMDGLYRSFHFIHSMPSSHQQVVES